MYYFISVHYGYFAMCLSPEDLFEGLVRFNKCYITNQIVCTKYVALEALCVAVLKCCCNAGYDCLMKQYMNVLVHIVCVCV
jgi:hypothetical protein